MLPIHTRQCSEGQTGRGKTHLAVAIGYPAIQNGFEALFTTAAELIEDLSNASKRGHLQKSLGTHKHESRFQQLRYFSRRASVAGYCGCPSNCFHIS
ncbi:MAG: ATP-binding protein [Candidatus Acidiferrales bacterium]